MTTEKKKKKKRGFAAMDPAKVKEIAALGAKKVTENSSRFAFTSEAAREAGRKGGKAKHATRGGRPKKVPGPIVPIEGEDRIVREPRAAFVPASEISAEKSLLASDYVGKGTTFSPDDPNVERIER